MRAQRLQDTALRYFLEVVRSGSVSEAASRLNVTPSAVSRQVAALEDLLRVPLFERRPRGMLPSPAGEMLAAHARRGALEADRVVADIEALQGLRRGRVRVCASGGFAIEFLPRAIALFTARHPGMQFHLRTAAPAAVTESVLLGDADIGLTFSRTAERDIEVQHRQPSPLMVIMRPDHPLAAFPTLTLAQIHAYPVALPDADNTSRQLFDIACSHRRLVFEPALVSSQFEALINFVLHAGGVSIAGEITVRERVRRGELRAALLRERATNGRTIELQTLLGRTLPEGVRAFLEQLRQLLPPPG